MAQIKASLDSKKNPQELTLVIPLSKPTASKSGKTMMVASTNGFQVLDGIMVDGKTVKVSINATIPV
jgi:hypothetical protein